MDANERECFGDAAHQIPDRYGENPSLQNDSTELAEVLRRSRQAMSFCPLAAAWAARSILNSNSPWTSWSSSLPGSRLQPSPLHDFIHHPPILQICRTPILHHSSTPSLRFSCSACEPLSNG